MTIQKAIEILQYAFKDPWVAPKGDFGDAIKLGIEALKRIEHCRKWTDSTWGSKLPGETEK